jgi:hypothetical protein
MRTKNLLTLAVAIIALAATTGCNRDLVLKAPLEPDEKVAKGDTVLVDGLPAGRLKDVVTEGGQRLAVLAIEDEAGARQKMRAGVVRVVQDGKVNLRTDGVANDSTPLPPGSVIPAKSKAAFVVGKIANKQIGLVALLALAGIALLVILFRSAKGAAVILLALTLAVTTGWVLHPYAVPWVEKLYQSAPSAASGNAQTGQTPDGESAKRGIASVERRAVDILSHRPDARLVAFVAISGAALLICGFVIRSAVCAFERDCS